MMFYIATERYGGGAPQRSITEAEAYRDDLRKYGYYGRVWIEDEDGNEVPELTTEQIAIVRKQMIRSPGEHVRFPVIRPTPVLAVNEGIPTAVPRDAVGMLTFTQHKYLVGRTFHWYARDQYGREVWPEDETAEVIAAVQRGGQEVKR